MYLSVENIGHSKIKVKFSQQNGIVERFQKILLDEFYQTACRKKIHDTIEEQQKDADK